MLPLDKTSDGGRKCILDDARSSDRQLTKAEVFEGVVRATPAVRFPELEVDSLYDKPVMVYWPMDRMTLSVLPYAVDARRLRQTRSWVVSWSISRRFEVPRLSHVDPLTAASTASTASRQRRHRIKFKVNFNTLTKHATLFFDVM